MHASTALCSHNYEFPSTFVLWLGRVDIIGLITGRCRNGWTCDEQVDGTGGQWVGTIMEVQE